MTEQDIQAGQRIVWWHAGWAAGASAIPLPFADMAGVMAVQIAMVRSLARLHGAPMQREQARALLLSALGSAVPPTVTALGIPSMMKAVPGIGTILGVATAPASAVAVTLALGDSINRRLAQGSAPPQPLLAAPEAAAMPASADDADPAPADPAPPAAPAGKPAGPRRRGPRRATGSAPA